MQQNPANPDTTSRPKPSPRIRGRRSLAILATGAVLAATFGLVHVIWRLSSGERAEASDSAVRDAMTTIGAAAHQWQVYYGDAVCPSVRQLVERKALDPTARKIDPWEQPFGITCLDTEVVVTSGGPDRILGTDDDIRVSSPRRK